jgi:hypothetical protein
MSDNVQTPVLRFGDRIELGKLRLSFRVLGGVFRSDLKFSDGLVRKRLRLLLRRNPSTSNPARRGE